MKAAGKLYDVVIYEGADHGFMRAGEQPDATEANKKARAAAWARSKGCSRSIGKRWRFRAGCPAAAQPESYTDKHG